MELHPALLAFHTRLDAAGVVAARHSDHLCVRLDLLCSVRVRYDGQRLRCEARVGLVSRGLATVATFGIAAGAVAGAALLGAALPIVVTAGTLGALAAGAETLRYLLTEATITRVTLLWELERAHSTQEGLFPADAGAAPLGALPPPAPELVPWPAGVQAPRHQG